MKHTIRTVETNSLKPGYKGKSCSFDWKPYSERSKEAQKDYDGLAESIRNEGIIDPLITYNGHVLIGMRRWEIAMCMGIEKVQIVDLQESPDNWTLQDVRRLKEWAKTI